MITVDSSELDGLAADLLLAAVKAPAAMRPLAQKAGLNIKTDWRETWSGMAHAPMLPLAVTYDTRVMAGVIEVEIGPDKDKPQGALGNLVEYGSVNNAPRPAGKAALEREIPKVERVAGELAERLLS